MDTTVLIVIACVVAYVVHWFLKRKNLPPGPFGLPIVGYLPFLTNKPHIKFKELSKKYGPVFSVRLGGMNIVVLNDFATIKKAFAQDAYFGRPEETPFPLHQDTLDTGAVNGLPWKEQRRVCLQMLREVGFGKTKMEEHIKEEITDLLYRFEQSNGEPFNAASILSPSMSNNIASLVFGRRMEFNDPKRIMLNKIFDDISEISGLVSWQLFFPLLGKIIKFLKLGHGFQFAIISQRLTNFVWDEITEHEKTLDPNNIRDFIDGYLLEIKKRDNEPAFKKTVLLDLVKAFFGAGSETVFTAVDWLMLTMAAYPDVQRKVHAEIDEVIGRERFPAATDRIRMPYTEAVILEVLRWISIVPLNLLRYTFADTELNGYFIPKHSRVMANIWGVHHDPELWGSDVEMFRPERFLTEDLKTLKRIDYLIPFSIGKRSCPGESLAKVEVFMYVAAIFQKFSVRLPKDEPADFEGILGIGLRAKQHHLHISKRQ